MNIGFVSSWFERGAAYVTKAYIESLKDDNNIYVYARGGEKQAKDDPNWNLPYVTWGYRFGDQDIDYKHFKKWINDNELEIIFFNEQQEIDIILLLKKDYPNLKIGSYIDYYRENTVTEFDNYDFLICNTKRHFSVFKNHPQAFYVPWGTDISLFKPKRKSKNKKITFFHSVGMSKRKGTDVLIDAFINSDVHRKSNLIIHSQLNVEKEFSISKKEMENYNIEVIEETVSAPGLYHLGDIYIYPTTLDGLGLTLYEALACGLPVVTTNNGPMNEVINNTNGYLVDVARYNSRSDGYYWPLSYVDKNSLIAAMGYYIDNFNKIEEYANIARNDAITNWNWNDRKSEINRIFENVIALEHDIDEIRITQLKRKKYKKLLAAIFKVFPAKLQDVINRRFRS